MKDNSRIIESDRLTVKLLNDTEIVIRPLTLSERKECISLLPKALDQSQLSNEEIQEGQSESFVNLYMKIQGDVIHYLIKRSNPEFKREDVDTQIDVSLIGKIIDFCLKDPFAELM